MAYNTALANATKHTDVTISATTYPTTTQATAIWTAMYLRIKGRFGAVGLTVSAAGDDLSYVQEIEALLTSCAVAQDNEMQATGEIHEHTRELCKRGNALLDEVCDRPDILQALGATYDTTVGPTASSLATDYPNDDYDATEVSEALPRFTTDMDL